MKFKRWVTLALTGVLWMTFCSVSAETTAAPMGEDLSGMFSARDYRTEVDESQSVAISLNGDTALCDFDSVRIEGSTVTILDEGTYIVSGTLDDGQIIVNAGKEDKVALVLNGVTIHSETSAAVYVLQADKVFVTTAAGSQNTLSNGGEFIAIDENKIDAVLFSKEDLTLNGEGSLTIQSPAGHGVVSKDDLVVTSGTYCITAASHGLSGKDSVAIAGGDFTITAGKDGIHAENNDDDTLGGLYIAGGSFAITSEGDGLSGEVMLQIDGGTLNIVTGGGSQSDASVQNMGDDVFPDGGEGPDRSMDTPPEAAQEGALWQRSGGKMGMDRAPDDSANRSSEQESTTVSAKGIKAAGNVIINGGVLTIDALDDALHSNACVTVNGGTLTIATGDDGIHADETLYILAGTIHITDSYEGLEGMSIHISGGDISIVSSDDGLNAAGGNDQSGFGGFGGDMFGSDPNCTIDISGGTLYIDASGDGIDSNGALSISGGEIVIAGPTGGGNGALDYGSEATISGGTVIALGSAQMAENFGQSSTQGAILVSTGEQPAGTVVQLADSDGQVLLSLEADKSFSSVVVSCPEITQGSTYTLTAGDYAVQITMNSLVYSTGNGGGGRGRH